VLLKSLRDPTFFLFFWACYGLKPGHFESFEGKKRNDQTGFDHRVALYSKINKYKTSLLQSRRVFDLPYIPADGHTDLPTNIKKADFSFSATV
jgi:hypothetical protein